MFSRECVHEAGHALVAALSEFRIAYVSTEVDRTTDDYEDHKGLLAQFDFGRPVEVAAVAAAGIVAETIAFGCAPIEEDELDIDNMVATLVLRGFGKRDAVDVAGKGYKLASEQLHSHWEALTAIAEGLEQKATLSGDQVQTIVRGHRRRRGLT